MILELKHISKSYAGLPVLRDINLSFQQGVRYCLMSPSGSGKTTLLRILMGLERADAGTLETDKPDGFGSLAVSAVFQENRLCDSFSPLENIMMCTGSAMKPALVREELLKLLPGECLTRPVSTLSGGMKRRTALLRALLTPSDILLMDEPFTGLDEALKQSVIEYIKEKQQGRVLILTTHQEEDIKRMDGRLIRLQS